MLSPEWTVRKSDVAPSRSRMSVPSGPWIIPISVSCGFFRSWARGTGACIVGPATEGGTSLRRSGANNGRSRVADIFLRSSQGIAEALPDDGCSAWRAILHVVNGSASKATQMPMEPLVESPLTDTTRMPLSLIVPPTLPTFIRSRSVRRHCLRRQDLRLQWPSRGPARIPAVTPPAILPTQSPPPAVVFDAGKSPERNAALEASPNRRGPT
jgi:hypothetical protein